MHENVSVATFTGESNNVSSLGPRVHRKAPCSLGHVATLAVECELAWDCSAMWPRSRAVSWVTAVPISALLPQIDGKESCVLKRKHATHTLYRSVRRASIPRVSKISYINPRRTSFQVPHPSLSLHHLLLQAVQNGCFQCPRFPSHRLVVSLNLTDNTSS